jgi:hypothetical protein
MFWRVKGIEKCHAGRRRCVFSPNQVHDSSLGPLYYTYTQTLYMGEHKRAVA